jgi:hypothetical protein
MTAVWLPAGSTLACAMCFGATNPGTQKAVMASVVFLAGVVGLVLTCIAYLGIAWTLKARRLAKGRSLS